MNLERENRESSPVLRHLADLCRRAETVGQWQYSGFLTPAEQQEMIRFGRSSGLSFSFDGGYAGAERRIAQGYADTQKALGGFVDAAAIHKQNELIFQAFEESERRYQERVSMLRAQGTPVLTRDVRDDYEELLEEFSASGDLTDPPGMDAEALIEDDAFTTE